MSGPLEGRIALVTGSTRGIGQAAAAALARDGAAVLVHGLERDEGRALVADLQKDGCRAAFSDADLALSNGAAKLQEDACAGLGEPDILMINASVEVLESWREVSEEAMRLQTEINLYATVRLLQAFLPAIIRKGWGRVIAVGSVQEHRPNETHFYYVATKAAQTNMILNLARTVRVPSITFNVVQPGAILTDRNRDVLADEAFRAKLIARIPLGRLGAPQDIAGLVAFLCSEGAAYINGAVISADGGLRL